MRSRAFGSGWNTRRRLPISVRLSNQPTQANRRLEWATHFLGVGSWVICPSTCRKQGRADNTKRSKKSQALGRTSGVQFFPLVRYDRFPAQFLERVDCDLATLSRGNSLGSSPCRRDRRDRRDPLGHRCSTNRSLIEECVLSVRRIDDELNAVAFDQVHYIRTTFLYLVDPLYNHAGPLQYIRRSLGGHQAKAQFHILPRQVHQDCFVAIVHAEEHGSLHR